MSELEALLAEVGARERRATIYRRGERTATERWLDSHVLEVAHRDLPPEGPDAFLVLEEGGRFVGAIGLTDLEWLLEPPIVRPGSNTDVSEGYRLLFELLDETLFTAMDRRHLLAVSREIEDRASRAGTGSLHAGFQSRETLDAQLDLYRDLATRTDLNIHVHGIVDYVGPEIAGLSFDRVESDELDRHWVVAFDGGPDGNHACGLVAVECPDGYTGFWTDERDQVDDIVAALTGT